jgi:hypothetical protein
MSWCLFRPSHAHTLPAISQRIASLSSSLLSLAHPLTRARPQAEYAREEGSYEAARLPYMGKEYAAVAILPDAGSNGTAGLLARAMGEEGFVSSMRWASHDLIVRLPRFKLVTQLSLKRSVGGVSWSVAMPFLWSLSRMFEPDKHQSTSSCACAKELMA